MTGDELYNYLLRNGPIPLEKAQKIFAQLVGAVSYVHNMSCVHRDLKLENILLDKNENVKLCDFGFTREYESKMSYLQTFCGTICYSAPEMLKGEKYAGEKVDVWSLGIILFALLTGELPFDDDDDMVTKHKILGSEPNYPALIPPDAKNLIVQLLSKRPLHRPSLADILTNPFLAAYAPQQQAILKLTQPAPFSTNLEKDTLERMRSAGVNIDKVIENVIAQRCDPLAGWWALLIEKEERKEKRRERKRKEREIEAKNLRRLSAASSRLERMAPPLKEVDEEKLSPPASSTRGRRRRSITPTRKLSEKVTLIWAEQCVAQIILQELPQLPEGTALDSPVSPTPPPPLEKDIIISKRNSIRSTSSSRRRPLPPPKERRRSSRGSTLHMISSNPNLLAPSNPYTQRRSRRHQHSFISHLASIKQWFLESAKRARSPGSKSEASTLKPPADKSPVHSRPPPASADVHHRSASPISPRNQSGPSHPPLRPRVTSPKQRLSLSPSPLTPRSSYRRSSAGLRGRKSTSSSVSSIRSIHHAHTHSKASSTSSNSNSVNSSALPQASHSSRSPHTSVKVLPATPTTSTFPSNIRIVRSSPYVESAFSGVIPSSPGLVFAKRKKTPFRGPMLNLSTNANNGGSGSNGSVRRDSSIGASRSASVKGRRSGEIIEEEDEDGFEEVDAFSPVPAEAEETIWELGNVPGKEW